MKVVGLIHSTLFDNRSIS